jgi:hypothetical protein
MSKETRLKHKKMKKPKNNITEKEYDALAQETKRDLNMVSQFYYELFPNRKAIIKKPSPRQVLNFINEFNDPKEKANRKLRSC